MLNALTYLGNVNVTTYSEVKAISTALEVVTEESAEFTEEQTVCYNFAACFIFFINPVSVNPTKWSNTRKQFVGFW